jgi:fermentation-respiration switch protein FrsA (DUF1100 family)
MSSVITVVLVLALIYCASLYIRQWSLVFRPSRKERGTPINYGIAFEDVCLSLRPGLDVHGWWIPGQLGDKAVIFFHGHIGNITHYIQTVNYLYSLGPSLLVIDYPGYGKSKGRPSERGCYLAADAAWDYLRNTKGYAPENIILYGRSLGSAVATYLASKHLCGGLVFHSGFTSMPDMAARFYPFIPVIRLFCHTRMNSLKRISRCECSILFLHSVSDEMIPIKHAYKVYGKACDPKRLVSYTGSHFGGEWMLSAEVRASWMEMLYGRA